MDLKTAFKILKDELTSRNLHEAVKEIEKIENSEYLKGFN